MLLTDFIIPLSQSQLPGAYKLLVSPPQLPAAATSLGPDPGREVSPQLLSLLT